MSVDKHSQCHYDFISTKQTDLQIWYHIHVLLWQVVNQYMKNKFKIPISYCSFLPKSPRETIVVL